MKITCECGEVITEFEEGEYGEKIFNCEECNNEYNVFGREIAFPECHDCNNIKNLCRKCQGE